MWPEMTRQCCLFVYLAPSAGQSGTLSLVIGSIIIRALHVCSPVQSLQRPFARFFYITL